jgi:hypothetical protein
MVNFSLNFDNEVKRVTVVQNRVRYGRLLRNDDSTQNHVPIELDARR